MGDLWENCLFKGPEAEVNPQSAGKRALRSKPGKRNSGRDLYDGDPCRVIQFLCVDYLSRFFFLARPMPSREEMLHTPYSAVPMSPVGAETTLLSPP